MKILCLDGRDVTAAGGALRGLEMSRALEGLGHEVRHAFPGAATKDPAAHASGVDAVILAGTWHQLTAGHLGVPHLSALCDERKIPCIWWYGSNGSVFGTPDPDPAKRAESERAVIGMICARKFISVICPYSMGIYQRHGVPLEKMRLVPSVFDGELFTPPQNPRDLHIAARMREDFGVPQKAFVIGTIGNTPNSKGGDDTIRAVALLAKEMPDLHYLILHSPEATLNRTRSVSPDKKKVGNSEWDVLQMSKKLAGDLGVADRVHFIGMRAKREAMPHFYWCCNIYCSPSKAENLGQPLIESQLCGLPLITYKGFSFDFCACPETTQQIEPHHTETDDYGLVIPFADPAVLARAIVRARATAEEESKYATNRTRFWAYHHFHHDNAQVMVDAIEEYRRLLA